MSFDRDQPFNDLPQLPPAAELETRAVLKRVISARTALADLKGAGSLIPNQAMLIQTIGVQEARLSSEIENVVTTSDQLYRALADDTRTADAATKEVLFYNNASGAWTSPSREEWQRGIFPERSAASGASRIG